MPATTRAELLAVTGREYAKLTKLIEPIPEAIALAKDAQDTSIKDVIAHRAHWVNMFFGWYHDGLAGAEVHFPAEGYKWNELPRYNADLRERQKWLGWDAARDTLDRNAAALLRFIEERDDDALYGGPMQGARNTWTVGRWVEATGPSHFRSAAKYVRARLKELTP